MLNKSVFGTVRSVLVRTLCVAALVSSGAALAAPERGGSLTVGLRFMAASLDPLFGNAPATDRKIYNLFAENLLMMDLSGKFQPVLAEKWDFENDGKAIVFHLRRDVRFQDGTPFNAEAVKFNLDRLLDPKVNAPSKQYVADLESVQVLDPYKVRVNLKRKSGVMLAMLAVEPGSMLSPTAIREKGADFARSPVGTGPFQIVSWSGNQISAKRNPNYWRKAPDGQSLPYLDKVEVKVIQNSAVRLVELQSGNAQLIDYLEVKDFEQITKNPNLAMVEATTAVAQLTSFNVKKPPFDNHDLRKAVSLGINRAALEKVIVRGSGGAMYSLEPPTTWVYDKSVRGHDYNLELARELYKKSGHKGPLVLSAVQRDPDTQIAQLMQSMLKSAGIDVQLEMLERTAFMSKVLNHSYEMAILQQSTSRPDPDMTYSDFFGATAARNYAGFDQSKVAAPLVAQARVESDLDARRKVYSSIQQYVLDNNYLSPLFWRPIRDGVSKRVEGLKREACLAFIYSEVSLKQP